MAGTSVVMPLSLPVNVWFPDTYIRPVAVALTPLAGLKSMVVNLIKVLLSTPVDVAPYLSVLNRVLPDVGVVYEFDGDVDGTTETGLVSNYLSSVSLDSVLQLATVSALAVTTARVYGDDVTSVDFVVHYPQPFERKTSDDEMLVDILLRVQDLSLNNDEVIEAIEAVLSLWEVLLPSEELLAGRGTTILSETDFSGVLTGIRSVSHEAAVFRLLASDFTCYLPLNTNFSFRSVIRTAGNIFNYATLAKDLALGAYRNIFGDPPAMVTKVSQVITKINDYLGGLSDKPGYVNNVNNSNVKDIVDNISSHEIATTEAPTMLLAPFYGSKKLDPGYNPIVGTPPVTQQTTSARRADLDRSGMALADLAVLLMRKDIKEGSLSSYSLRTLREYLSELENNARPGASRAPIGTSFDSTHYASNWWTQERPAFSTSLGSAGSATENQRILTTLLSNDPYMFSVVNEQGDLIDSKDVRDIQKRVTDQLVELQNLRAQVRTLTSSLPTLPVTTAGTMQYQNWRLTPVLAAHVHGSWSSTADALNLVNTLVTAGFKYNSVRDDARSHLTGSFVFPLSIDRNVRFPASGSYVCRSSPEVSSAINDVLAALNYKDTGDTTGTTVGTSHRRTGASGGDVVRATSEYADASLAYTTALEKLRVAIGNCSLDRTRFEEKFGLYWA